MSDIIIWPSSIIPNGVDYIIIVLICPCNDYDIGLAADVSDLNHDEGSIRNFDQNFYNGDSEQRQRSLMDFVSAEERQLVSIFQHIEYIISCRFG